MVTKRSLQKAESAEVAASVQSKPKKPYIGSRDEADPWVTGNKYIHEGYRINYSTPWLAVKSTFAFHNETVNIWSHWLGVFAALAIALYLTYYLQTPTAELKNVCSSSLADCTLQHQVQASEFIHPEPSFLHYYYNTQVEQIKSLEATIKAALMSANLQNCTECLSAFLQSVGPYLRTNLAGLKSRFGSSVGLDLLERIQQD